MTIEAVPPAPPPFEVALPLSSTATSWVAQELSSTEEQLKALDEQATRLRAQLSLLDAQRALLCHKIVRYRRAISPIHLVPPEIWREIFLFCTPEPLHILPMTTEPRLIITQACSLWREIALSIPELWSAYEVRLTSIVFPHGVRTRSLHMIETCFPRARSRTLSLTMEQPRDGYSYPLYTIPDILKPHAHQFHHLDLTLHPQEIRNWFRHLVNSRALPRVRYFALRSTSSLGSIGSGLHEDLSRVNIPLSTMAPLAQEIILKLPTFNLLSLSLPSHHLTVVELFELECGNGFADYANVLQNCTTLERLYITFSPTMEGRPPSAPQSHYQSALVLPNLTKLELRASSLEVSLFFFQSFPPSISFPSLASLSLDSGYADLSLVNDFKLLPLSHLIHSFSISDFSSSGEGEEVVGGGTCGRFLRELGEEALFPNMKIFALDVHESIENSRPRRSMSLSTNGGAGLHARCLTRLLKAVEARHKKARCADGQGDDDVGSAEVESYLEASNTLGAGDVESAAQLAALQTPADTPDTEMSTSWPGTSNRTRGKAKGKAKAESNRPPVKLNSIRIGYQSYHLTVDHQEMIDRLRDEGLDLVVTDERVAYY